MVKLSSTAVWRWLPLLTTVERSPRALHGANAAHAFTLTTSSSSSRARARHYYYIQTGNGSLCHRELPVSLLADVLSLLLFSSRYSQLSCVIHLASRGSAPSLLLAAHEMAAAVPMPAHPTFDVAALIAAALEEDAGGVGDVTSLATCAAPVKNTPQQPHAGRSIPAEALATATLLAKAAGVLAGQALADLVLAQVDNTLTVGSPPSRFQRSPRRRLSGVCLTAGG